MPLSQFYSVRRPTKTLRRRFWSFCDDCEWWWEKNRQGFIGGFILGALAVLIATEFAFGV